MSYTATMSKLIHQYGGKKKMPKAPRVPVRAPKQSHYYRTHTSMPKPPKNRSRK